MVKEAIIPKNELKKSEKQSACIIWDEGDFLGGEFLSGSGCVLLRDLRMFATISAPFNRTDVSWTISLAIRKRSVIKKTNILEQ